ncbi:glycosyltransferase family 2 protein [Pedobacter frigoris]|uniref:glycosyltransferase family 2 protein n=1 Tax=Pedobacter frigoris TaxID=2571272 RepID=UPI00292EC9E5|nr:glycosyltransferase [Pedobacter frigoris]
MRIAFICVNYNNSKITAQYIESVLAIRNEYDVKIVVVDNASYAHEIMELDAIKYPELTVIKSDENLGYFKGLNLGINSLEVNDFDFLVIGNNDLTFDPAFLDNLIKIEFSKDVLVLAPNIIRIDGVHQNPHIVHKFSGFQRLYRKLYYSNYMLAWILQNAYGLFKSKIVPEDRAGHDEAQEIVMGYGACYVLTRHFFQHFRDLNAPIFLMGEEGILADQVLSVNGVTLYHPDIKVNHHDHASIGKVSIRKLYKFSRDSYKHYIKNLKYVQ